MRWQIKLELTYQNLMIIDNWIERNMIQWCSSIYVSIYLSMYDNGKIKGIFAYYQISTIKNQ